MRNSFFVQKKVRFTCLRGGTFHQKFIKSSFFFVLILSFVFQSVLPTQAFSSRLLAAFTQSFQSRIITPYPETDPVHTNKKDQTDVQLGEDVNVSNDDTDKTKDLSQKGRTSQNRKETKDMDTRKKKGKQGNPHSDIRREEKRNSSIDEKPVVIIAHGMMAFGSLYRFLRLRFEYAGYEVYTPSSAQPFRPDHIIEVAESLPDKKFILVGHSAGGAAVQRAAYHLGDQVIGVISIDGAPVLLTNPRLPHAFFRHEDDGFGNIVGNQNLIVPSENLINGGVVTLRGGHLVAPTGIDATHYISAAKEIENRGRQTSTNSKPNAHKPIPTNLSASQRPLIIIAHGMGANGNIYASLADKFRDAGYDVKTPTAQSSAFLPDHIIRSAHSNAGRKVILIGHSAGGAAVQRAAVVLRNQVIGIISIDGAPVTTTYRNIPHAFFRHENDGFGSLVGNINPSVPKENILFGDVVTLPGGHLIAPFGSDAKHYINAAVEIEAMTY